MIAQFGDPLPTSDEGLEDGEYWVDIAGMTEEMSAYCDFVLARYQRDVDAVEAQLAQAQEEYDLYVEENPEDEEGIAEKAAAVEELAQELESRTTQLESMRVETESAIEGYQNATFLLSEDGYVLRAPVRHEVSLHKPNPRRRPPPPGTNKERSCFSAAPFFK